MDGENGFLMKAASRFQRKKKKINEKMGTKNYCNIIQDWLMKYYKLPDNFLEEVFIKFRVEEEEEELEGERYCNVLVMRSFARRIILQNSICERKKI